VPSVLLILVSIVFRPPPEPNRTQGLVSPSGQYTLSVPIVNDRHRVTIRDNQGNLEYEDKQSDFVGWLSAYWIWDDQDRVWLYNSDDGRVFCWEKQGKRWKKIPKVETEVGVEPPPELFPDYAKNHEPTSVPTP
jgi:hypothetical protein